MREVDSFFELPKDEFLSERAGIDRASLFDGCSQFVEDLAALLNNVLPAESSQQRLCSFVREQPVHGRQFAERIPGH